MIQIEAITNKESLINYSHHDLATLIQLEHIIFQIHELNDVAIFNTEKQLLQRKDIKEIVEPYIFPILSTNHDNEVIKSYFELIYLDELQMFNKQGYNFQNALDIAPATRQKAISKIRKQIRKQEKLKEYYNTHY